ncbi:peroxiredoxin 1 [Cerrena zonata]|uniref:Peroxiredoxin 1 n=1 Tax=Cerrena zonata TaxID=2478898 RepID=A0AAW0FMJ4_9APHY
MLSRQLLRLSANASKARCARPMAIPRLARPSGTQLVGRFYSTFNPKDQPRVRIGSTAPNFTVDTTEGEIDFHKYIGDQWVVLFSHPADFTPVCTTELGAFARLKPEFDQRNVKLIGLSTEGVESHKAWIKDMEDVTTGGAKFSYPIIADSDKKVAFLYDMLSEEDFNKIGGGMVPTVRSVFVIDPSKKVRLIMTYPASTGRNSAEVLRVVDALQLADSKGIATPIDWSSGEDVIIPPSISDDAAKAKFGEFKTLKSYLRTTKSPIE